MGRSLTWLTSLSILYSIHVSMTSCVKTSPLRRKAWSALRASSASSRETAAEGMVFNSSGDRPYMSLSSGSPGCILFCMPSSPDISMAAKARYPLHDGSGYLTSILLDLGEGQSNGILIEAERLRD